MVRLYRRSGSAVRPLARLRSTSRPRRRRLRLFAYGLGAPHDALFIPPSSDLVPFIHHTASHYTHPTPTPIIIRLDLIDLNLLR